jgi:CBS domain-containing protein
MQLIKDILKLKGNDFLSVTSDTSVCQALKLMMDQGVGSTLVVDGEELRGLFSERDCAKQMADDCSASLDAPIENFMSSPVLCTRPDQSINECMALMTDKRIRHLPVITDGKIVGIVSIGDLVKAVISEQQFVIEQLEHYIAS